MSDWVALRDALGLTLRPIDAWPGKKRYSYDRSPYSAGIKDTLSVLKRELKELNARDIVLQVAIPEEKLRLDGLPRAGATAEHPGVILSFTGKHGPLRIHFDRFSLWHQNLRAIAMHLYDLRHASLYGVGADGEQYRGWKALPAAPAGAEPAPMEFETNEAAARYLANMAGNAEKWREILLSERAFRDAYREACAAYHPDSNPGQGADLAFKNIQEAAWRLREMHGRSKGK